MPPRRDPGVSDDATPTLQEQLQSLIQVSTMTAGKIDTLVTHMGTQTETLANIVNILSDEPKTPHHPPPPPPPPNNNPRPPKILLPTFDGHNALDWLFQANNYFDYYAIPPPQRLTLTGFYFTGDALSWYKHLAHNRLLGTWPEFARALELRFGPSSYENHQATLFKLQQVTTVTAYQTEFEKISNRVIGLTPDALLNCFISGLRFDIQNELAILRPTTLNQASGLAKLIEDKLTAQISPSVASSSLLSPQNQPLLAAPKPPPATLPIKKLTPVELQKRRAEGLCYNCPEKYRPGHRCQPPQFLILQSDHDPPWGNIPTDNFGLADKADF